MIGNDQDIRRPLLRYHGGKWKLAKWIISHFTDHQIYCEPFGGAASVLLQKRPCHAEVYNDLDLEVVNLFRVARESGPDLVDALHKTPFAREEFELSYLPIDDDFERARRTVIRSFMGFASGLQSHQRTGFRSNSHRSGTTPVRDWKNYPEALRAIIERLRGVVIENRDSKEVMMQHDGDNTLHYLDPPYVLDTRYKGQKTKVYRNEMDNEAHIDLCNFIKDLRGHVIISGYENNIYNDILKGWYKSTKKTHADGAKERLEVLWSNREVTIERQIGLLDEGLFKAN